jgi:predicted DNA-binding transcriptional regulator YafY
MPISDAQSKEERLYLLQKLFEQPGRRLRTYEIAEKLGVSDDTAKRYIAELSTTGRLPLRKDGQFWILAEYARIEHLQVHLSVAEATALYVAGRLLSQIHDERNRHVLLALTKLVEALPAPLQLPQRAVVDTAMQRQQGQEDRSQIFEAIAMGWANRRKVRLRYSPPKKRTFECSFSPYLLEPSGIGRTIYAIGQSDPPNALRTYKLERIEQATITEEPFLIPEDFDGPALLARAWGVMYGDEELVEVRLRFSHAVTKRVRETLWHPTQTITQTSEGCEWSALIGDTLEIENWIRGWGADCEVLAPQNLREKIIVNVRQAARMYRIAFGNTKHTDPTKLDEEVFNSFFGE